MGVRSSLSLSLSLHRKGQRGWAGWIRGKWGLGENSELRAARRSAGGLYPSFCISRRHKNLYQTPLTPLTNFSSRSRSETSFSSFAFFLSLLPWRKRAEYSGIAAALTHHPWGGCFSPVSPSSLCRFFFLVPSSLHPGHLSPTSSRIEERAPARAAKPQLTIYIPQPTSLLHSLTLSLSLSRWLSLSLFRSLLFLHSFSSPSLPPLGPLSLQLQQGERKYRIYCMTATDPATHSSLPIPCAKVSIYPTVNPLVCLIRTRPRYCMKAYVQIYYSRRWYIVVLQTCRIVHAMTPREHHPPLLEMWWNFWLRFERRTLVLWRGSDERCAWSSESSNEGKRKKI